MLVCVSLEISVINHIDVADNQYTITSNGVVRIVYGGMCVCVGVCVCVFVCLVESLIY